MPALRPAGGSLERSGPDNGAAQPATGAATDEGVSEMTFDWPALEAAWMPDDPWQPDPETPRYYGVKYDIAYKLQPISILEIGVRAGYSALAFLMACPQAEYRGLDAYNGDWGGVDGSREHAAKILNRYRVWLQTVDTQTITDPIPGYEFWHIDGDHSFRGTLRDLRLAGDSGARWILLDDYDFISDVQLAGNAFAHQNKGRYTSEPVTDGGYRGNLLLTRTDDG